MSGDASARGEIYVVDDDPAAREVLSQALRGAGYEVIHFADGAALLTETKARVPACIFLDAHAEGAPLALLKRLRLQECAAPIFVASAKGSIPMAVDAIRSGAFDFVEKPFRIGDIVARVDAATGAQARASDLEKIKQFSQRLSGETRLTPREHEVFALIAMGRTNKQIARELRLSSRTIEGYRAAIMRKVGARNATELVSRLLDRSGSG